MAIVDLQDDPRTYDPSPIGPVVGDTQYRVPEPFDLAAEYRNFLGRAPDAGELATEPGNVERYGLEQLRSNLRDRAKNNPSGVAPSGGGPRGIGPLFDDPASAQLQGIAQAQMGEVRSNPGLNSLMAFLDKEFSRLSTNPGYSPEDLAILNTQAFEPIEQRRQADQRRVLERTSARGFLPSSGLTEDLSQQADTEANRQRTVAGRDLAINAIGQRRADLDRALQLGSLRGLDIPRSQRSEELALAQLLYQMPRNALMDLLAVINGSPSSTDIFSQQLQSNQQSLYQQQQNDQRNAALMQQIGAILGQLFR
jgi:hypothetical protein